MIVWLAMAIPLVCAAVLYYRFNRTVVWWEFLVPFAASALFIGLAKWSTETCQTQDTEYWGGWIKAAEYYEDWDEEVSCRHPKYCTRRYSCGTSNEPRTCEEQYQCGYEHLYDVDYHPPRWVAEDSNGQGFTIDEGSFERLVRKFGNRQYVDLHRSYHSNDGDKYVATWTGTDTALEPVTTVHTYENRVQASHSVFNFPDVDPKKYGLFDYPKVEGYWWCRPILGDGGPTMQHATDLLGWWNAKLGPTKQVRIMILVFSGQPLQAAFEQEAYWKGGNKNEFILAIGVDRARTIQWSKAISWTEREDLKVDARNFVADRKGLSLDLVEVVNWLGPQVQARFERKHFRDFNYLTIDPPDWVVILVFLGTIAINLLVSWWAVQNQYTEESAARFR